MMGKPYIPLHNHNYSNGMPIHSKHNQDTDFPLSHSNPSKPNNNIHHSQFLYTFYNSQQYDTTLHNFQTLLKHTIATYDHNNGFNLST